MLWKAEGMRPIPHQEVFMRCYQHLTLFHITSSKTESLLQRLDSLHLGTFKITPQTCKATQVIAKFSHVLHFVSLTHKNGSVFTEP